MRTASKLRQKVSIPATKGSGHSRAGQRKGNSMHMKMIFAATLLFGLLPVGPAVAQQVAADELEFQQMAAALKANDTERRSAIAACIQQGIGDNPKNAAQFMGVPVDQAAEAWCTRMTNGIVNGQLTLADVNALNEGTVTPSAQQVLTTVSEGE
jgi:hypothetical protein